MKSKLIFLFFLVQLCLSIKTNTSAQDPLFSQYFSNPLYLNPAYAGSFGGSRIATSYRDQWPSIPGTFQTFTASYDQYVNNIGGIGFQYLSDDQGKGIIKTNTISSMYAYDLIINNDLHIRPAINIGFGVEKLDLNKLTFGDQIGYDFIVSSSEKPPYYDARYYFNAGIGLMLTYKNLISGISYDHINRPDVGYYSTSRLPAKFTIHSSYQFDFADKFSLTPGIIYQQQQDFKYIMPSVMLRFWYFKVGTAVRVNLSTFDNSNNTLAMIGFANKWMSISYSHDYYNNSAFANSGGANEITAIFKFNCINKDKHGVTSLYGF